MKKTSIDINFLAISQSIFKKSKKIFFNIISMHVRQKLLKNPNIVEHGTIAQRNRCSKPSNRGDRNMMMNALKSKSIFPRFRENSLPLFTSHRSQNGAGILLGTRTRRSTRAGLTSAVPFTSAARPFALDDGDRPFPGSALGRFRRQRCRREIDRRRRRRNFASAIDLRRLGALRHRDSLQRCRSDPPRGARPRR